MRRRLTAVRRKLGEALARILVRPVAFKEDKLRSRDKYRSDYEVVGRSLVSLLEFESAFDIGCGNGFLMSEFKKAGKTVGGIDVSPAVEKVLGDEIMDLVKIGDFSQAEGRWDLVCCVEVAEHIHPKRSGELAERIVKLARKWIYFTAAPQGQHGHGHINCRPHTEWMGWFTDLGWVCDDMRTNELRETLGVLKRAVWLRNNSFVLVRRTH